MSIVPLSLACGSQPVAVATSGGSDSMALVCALKEREPERTIIALHVDHRLRASSTAEAYQVKRWLAERGIACVILTIDPPLDPTRGNLPEGARKARYALLEKWCKEHHIDLLATAHHQGDQAETFLMRLARGSGVDGLACIAPQRVQSSGITLIRPMLHWRKTDAIHFLQQRGIAWIEDPTNQQACYQRNRWRMMMPQLEQEGLTQACLARQAMHMARVADYMQHHTRAWMQQHHVFDPMIYASLPCDAWRALHPELALRVLRACLMHIQPFYIPRFDALEQLFEALHMPNAKPRTLHGCMIRVRRDRILIYREYAHCAAPCGGLELPILWDDRVRVQCVRPEGVTCGALGLKGLAWLRKQTVHKIPDLPATLLYSLPTFFHLEQPFAIPHIDYYAHPCEKEDVVCLMHDSVGIDAEF